ncbi:restriction endonuclease subunit S [Streptococcus mutans]|uniref:restriction endonuclease subunit S n=1 Tax=Streptococcus mutans TaxID=1309 RepID=UPI0014553FED|nr:restriction endonuclease subunit S [Streptococcus mutans]NLQ75433.1 restriction endonuclease [Streptococcus mutans]
MSKLKLTDVEWGEFKIGSIFETTRGKRHIEKNRKKGSIPYYSASSVNNGVTDFISNPLFVMGNKIVVTTFCDAFYAGNTFTASDEITILDNKYLNKYNGLFISNSIISNKSKYAFGRKAFTERIKEQIIMLPIDFQGQPNWQFMEDYIKQEQKQQAQKIIDYYERKLVELAGDVVGLDKVEWKEFSVGELFDIKIGKNIDGNKVDRMNGETAYITRKENTNGLDGFVDYDSEFLNSIYPVITIGNETAEPYVQEFPFFTGTKVNILLPKFKMDTAILKYIATSLRQHKGKYSYSFTINSTRLKKQNILLPADKNGNPDFRYMSDFVKKLELDKVQEVLEYIYIYIKLKTMLEEKVCEISWKDFWIENICEIKSGVRLTKANQEVGERPFIGASDSDNGVTAFVSNRNKSLDKNVLGVNYNGSVVENFYHPYEAIFSDDVKRLKWKDRDQGNKYTYLFLKQMILSQKIKYAYGYKFNGERMKRQKIMLPVNEIGRPDYDYMKSYMQKRELEQIYAVLKYLNN